MKRLQNWPSALDTFITARRAQPFAWGVQDCCMFAADALQVQTGHDAAAALGLRGRYKCARGAANVLRRWQGDITQIPLSAGLTPTSVWHAGRGHIVAHPFAGRLALGVCLGTDAAFATATGLVFIPTFTCAHAWRV